MRAVVVAVAVMACSCGGAGTGGDHPTPDASVDATLDTTTDATGEATADARVDASGDARTDGAAVDGVCGAAANDSFVAAPSTGLCASGIASAVTGGGPWTWTCSGIGSGKSATCTAEALPAAVVAAGYAVHTFASAFDTKTVDTTDSKASGFDWYVWNLYGHADAFGGGAYFEAVFE